MINDKIFTKNEMDRAIDECRKRTLEEAKREGSKWTKANSVGLILSLLGLWKVIDSILWAIDNVGITW